MLTKILITGLLVLGALTALRAFGRASTTRMDRAEAEARDKVRRELRGVDTVPCPDCGAYVVLGEPCACQMDQTRSGSREA